MITLRIGRHLLALDVNNSLNKNKINWKFTNRAIGNLRGSKHFSQSTETSTNSEKNVSGDNKTVDFGFETVTVDEKARKVHEVFKNVASKYDLMNDVMSVGIHRVWKDHFVRRMSPIRPGTKIIDVAGGTGDIAFRMVQSIQRQENKYQANLGDLNAPEENRKVSSILVSDINQAMLDVGKERALNMNLQSDLLSWLCADAQQLPLAENSFDLYTIAFGIRNVVDVSKALNEAYRLLKPGGRFMCLEFSHVKNPLLKWAYDTYSFQIIPPLGEVVAGDWKSYQYLVESIRKFPTQDRFKNMIEEAGFRSVRYENLSFGVVSIHSAKKLDRAFCGDEFGWT